jgi:hypothetical protein
LEIVPKKLNACTQVPALLRRCAGKKQEFLHREDRKERKVFKGFSWRP